jgi:hypothetical protein
MIIKGQSIGKFETITTTSSKALNADNYDGLVITALAENLTITGFTSVFAIEGLKFTLIIKDDGTRRTLDFGAIPLVNGQLLPIRTTSNAMKFEFQYLNIGGSLGWYCVDYKFPESFPFAASDESTALATGTAKLSGHWPYNFNMRNIFIGLSVVSSSGNVIIDMNDKNGTSIFSTRPTILATEFTSLTNGTQPVISTVTFAKGDLWTIDIDSSGTGAKGIKIYPDGLKY